MALPGAKCDGSLRKKCANQLYAITAPNIVEAIPVFEATMYVSLQNIKCLIRSSRRIGADLAITRFISAAKSHDDDRRTAKQKVRHVPILVLLNIETVEEYRKSRLRILNRRL